MPLERLNPAGLAHPGGYHHVVKDGNTIYVAGQVSRDKDGKTVGVGDAAAQADQIFSNVQAALNAAGSDMNHIKKLNVFLTHREDIPAYRAARGKFISNDALPVSTLILCAGLADPDFRIEIEVIASVS
ncbi:MAG: RidA family protein [Chloroflexi bacterium]|nr:RidA family protein [Chloroflexota bacterium]